MNARNCKSCGRLFNYIAGPPLCPVCREDLENQFQKVKEYIANNRDTSVAAVAEACEVSEKQIKQWVREERLVFAEGVVSGITCEVCGATIATGRFCENVKTFIEILERKFFLGNIRKLRDYFVMADNRSGYQLWEI